MPEYRRFIAYFYEYINGKKQRNAGFAKVELRNGMWRILFRLTTDVLPEPPVQVYGFVRERGYLLGFALGTMQNGCEVAEEWAYRAEAPIGFGKYRLEDLSGIWIQSAQNRCFITVWDDDPIDMERFVLELPENNDVKERTEQRSEAEREVRQEEVQRSEAERSVKQEEVQRSEAERSVKQEKAQSKEAERSVEQEEVQRSEAEAERSVEQEQVQRSEAEREVRQEGEVPGDEAEREVKQEEVQEERRYEAEQTIQKEGEGSLVLQSADVEEDEREKCDMQKNSPAVDSSVSESGSDCDFGTGKPERDEAESERLAETLFRERQGFEPFEDQEIGDCVMIMPCDILRLQQAGWQAGRSSFLQHGYYQYRHLLLGRSKNGAYVLGVPGIRSRQEQYMAHMFGYEQFKMSKILDCGRAFGYWYRVFEKQCHDA